MTHAAATSTRPPPRFTAWGRFQFSFLLLVCLLLAGLGIFVVAIFKFGGVAGQEFSPDLFERRTFAYYELPWAHWQITPIAYNDTTGDLEAFLTSNNYVARLPANPTWHAISAERAGARASEGAARILVTYLEKETFSGDGVWLKWTKDHAAVAKVLWPAVADTARNEQYAFVPDLFELALAASDATKFQAELNRLLAAKYAHWATQQEQLENLAQAQAGFQKSLALDPTNATAKAGAARLSSVSPPAAAP